MSERMDRARVEAARDAFYQARWEQKKPLDPLRFGVEWADAHPYSTPEDLVAAYEEGQRDAVEKGLANPQRRTITPAQSEAILEAGRAGRYEDHEAALRAAGIEVRDE